MLNKTSFIYGLATAVPKSSTPRLNNLKNHTTQCPKDDVLPTYNLIYNLKLKKLSISLTYLQVNKM